MKLSPTGSQVKQVAELLEQEFATSTEAAKAVIELSWSIYAERARFMVVAALATASDENEAEAKVVVVGPYPSDTTARNAALSSQLADEAEWRWVVPIYGGTPARLLTERRKAKQAEADAERNAEKYSFLVPLAVRDQLEAELNALVDGKLTLEELKIKYPESGWVPESVLS